MDGQGAKGKVLDAVDVLLFLHEFDWGKRKVFAAGASLLALRSWLFALRPLLLRSRRLLPFDLEQRHWLLSILDADRFAGRKSVSRTRGLGGCFAD